MRPVPQPTRTLYLSIWSHLSRRRRIQLACLPLVMLVSAFAELISLGAILPFLTALSEPERLWQQPLVKAFSNWVSISQASELLIPAILLFSAAVVLAALIRLGNLWLNDHLSAAIGSDLSCEAYRRTLYQPYEVHIQKNTSEAITSSTSYVTRTIMYFNALLQLITASVVAVGLLTGILLMDWVMALAAATLFGSIYCLLAIAVRKKLRRNSNQIVVLSQQQIQALQEGLGAIRDVLLDGLQPTYVEIYRKADRPQRLLQAKNKFLGAFPRYIVEALGLLIIVLLGGFLVLQQGSGTAAIPLLGTLALGVQRLLPVLQQIFSSWSVLKATNADLVKVVSMLNQPVQLQENGLKPLPLLQSIRLESVHFKYGEKLSEVLQGLDLEIRRGERVALIGSTGSGKSTTVDLIMGLLKPTAGRILIDGKDLHDPDHSNRLAEWRASIAHVPQTIYLSDCSIAENIAFGVPLHEIDFVRLKKAAEQAQIAGFIEDSLQGYESFVGERGIRLSGGQRQRIGIARALYKQADVLVLDEATSALDTATEEAVMTAVDELNLDITILMISHRLSTVKSCDRAICIANGKISRDTSVS